MMSIIISHILIVLGCMIPAMIANATPVLVRHIPFWWQAIWLAWLGAHKTWRGLISGTVVGTVVWYYILTQLWTMMSHSGILHFYVHGVSLWLLAFLLSFGALVGDAFKSYRKRRNHIPSGEVFMPWDQIDYIMGAFVLSCWCINWSYIDFMLMCVLGWWLSYSVHYLWYLLGLINTKH